MKLHFAYYLVFALATTEAIGASNWFTRTVYNRWHETELERWLSDHDIPYPSPADRKDLENLVKSNWQFKVQKPLEQAAEKASDQLQQSKEWIFDTWSDSQLKAFLDRHGIPCPQPRRRDVLLRAARENYETIAKKLGEAASYPGNWLYDQWSESDLKLWLDERGWPIPQPTTRDRLIASVRRNARLATIQARNIAASITASAAAAQSSLSEALFNAWSDSDLKMFLDEHGVHVPQGSKRNELVALARKNRASLVSDVSTAASAASDYMGAATSRAGNEYARATDNAQLKVQEAFDTAVSAWSNSRLKAFLDARGIPVPQSNKRDELLAKVKENRHKVATTWNAWTFDSWDTESLKKYLSSINAQVAQRADATREELLKEAQDAFTRASKAGGAEFASATSFVAEATASVIETTFGAWSHSDLKAYLDSYGIPVYQGSEINELRAAARRNAHYFKYGTSGPKGPFLTKLQEVKQWILDQVKIGAASGRAQGEEAAEKMKERLQETVEEIRSEL